MDMVNDSSGETVNRYPGQVADLRLSLVISMINLRHGAVTLQELSQSCNLSASRLRHIFRTELGVSVSRFLKAKRLGHAKLLLTNTFLSVKEIAAATNAGDQSHFMRDFKKAVGMTPTAYRSLSRQQ